MISLCPGSVLLIGARPRRYCQLCNIAFENYYAHTPVWDAATQKHVSVGKQERLTFDQAAALLPPPLGQ